MIKKILFISDTPTHPQNAGNRSRIFNMASFLIEQGHEVHFLHSLEQLCDEEKMKEFWKDRYHVVEYKKPVQKQQSGYLNTIKHLLNPNLKYLIKTDDNYNLLLDDFIRNLIKKISFDVVIVEYIFLSKAFLHFDKHVLKVIDTHDVMTNRHKMFLKSGKEPSWYSTTASEEKKGLERADVIIAIQEPEKKFFSKLTRKKVVNVGHLLELHEPVNTEHARRKILFVGSQNPINQYGITHFLDNIYPIIQRKIPGIELLIAGKICHDLKEIEGVKLLGEVESMKTAYDMADIIINPLIFGTGLKIKMIEALSYSKAVISTVVGAEGLEDGIGTSFLCADTPEEYVNAISDILSNQKLFKSLSTNARSFAGSWNNKNASQLLELFQ